MSLFKAAPDLPDTLFIVFHHYAIPLGSAVESPIAVCTVSLGTYSSFFTAQAVAVSALEVSLATLRSAGFKGRFCRDIDLLRRGLITQITENGQERPLSEYELQAIPLHHRVVHGEAFLDISGQPVGRSRIIVPLPQRETHMTLSDVEQDPLWAQSCIPYFHKRAEGPFRSIKDAPYIVHFVLNNRVTEAHEQAATEVMVDNDDDERDVPYDQQQATIGRNHQSPRTKPDMMEILEKERSRLKEKNGAKRWKLSGTGAARKDIGGGKDIGPIYRGRRHSSSLE